MKSLITDSTDLRLLQALQQDTRDSNQALAERLGLSPATCMRRLRRLRESGLIEREVALLDPARVGPLVSAVIEISLDRQDAQSLDAFEARLVAEDEVQQCWRVSPGPDFILVVAVRDMPAYQALAQRLFTRDANVRNVKAFFSLKRAKFDPQLPLPAGPSGTERPGS